jgi:transcriptional regulator with XRE-family HTH domain
MPEIARIYPMQRPRPEVRSPERSLSPERLRSPERSLSPEPLWREVLGRRLRALRADRAETLAETADRAGISPQYLSEIERGRKEPSSEMIAALAGALDTTLADLTTQVTEDLHQSQSLRAAAASSSTRATQPAHATQPARVTSAQTVRAAAPSSSTRATPTACNVLALAA